MRTSGRISRRLSALSAVCAARQIARSDEAYETSGAARWLLEHHLENTLWFTMPAQTGASEAHSAECNKTVGGQMLPDGMLDTLARHVQLTGVHVAAEALIHELFVCDTDGTTHVRLVGLSVQGPGRAFFIDMTAGSPLVSASDFVRSCVIECTFILPCWKWESQLIFS